jgi:hypothetical protein
VDHLEAPSSGNSKDNGSVFNGTTTVVIAIGAALFGIALLAFLYAILSKNDNKNIPKGHQPQSQPNTRPLVKQQRAKIQVGIDKPAKAASPVPIAQATGLDGPPPTSDWKAPPTKPVPKLVVQAKADVKSRNAEELRNETIVPVEGNAKGKFSIPQ